MVGGKVNRDDRQLAFLTAYIDPNSETYADAYNSAKVAGFSETYCKNITQQMPDWIENSLKHRMKMLAKAEERLDESLDSDDEKIVQDTAKFIAKTLGKQVYSERIEQTGPNGKDLKPTIIVYGDNDLLHLQLDKDKALPDPKEKI